MASRLWQTAAMQLVMVCGGKGRRLRSVHHGPKSLLEVGGATLVSRIIEIFVRHHDSLRPPVVIVDAADGITSAAIKKQLPLARIIRQPRPDGVANALLLAESMLDDTFIVVLGDLFLDGIVADLPRTPALIVWNHALETETRKNFGIAVENGVARYVLEKPAATGRLFCGIGAYVLNRDVLACFRRAAIDAVSGERGITAGLQTAIESGIRFECLGFSGYYNNVNTPDDARAVERYLHLRAS